MYRQTGINCKLCKVISFYYYAVFTKTLTYKKKTKKRKASKRARFCGYFAHVLARAAVLLFELWYIFYLCGFYYPQSGTILLFLTFLVLNVFTRRARYTSQRYRLTVMHSFSFCLLSLFFSVQIKSPFLNEVFLRKRACLFYEKSFMRVSVATTAATTA